MKTVFDQSDASRLACKQTFNLNFYLPENVVFLLPAWL